MQRVDMKHLTASVLPPRPSDGLLQPRHRSPLALGVGVIKQLPPRMRTPAEPATAPRPPAPTRRATTRHLLERSSTTRRSDTAPKRQTPEQVECGCACGREGGGVRTCCAPLNQLRRLCSKAKTTRLKATWRGQGDVTDGSASGASLCTNGCRTRSPAVNTFHREREVHSEPHKRLGQLPRTSSVTASSLNLRRPARSTRLHRWHGTPAPAPSPPEHGGRGLLQQRRCTKAAVDTSPLPAAALLA
jgi:hypothetical protein